jgi:hypothetical protein
MQYRKPQASNKPNALKIIGILGVLFIIIGVGISIYSAFSEDPTIEEVIRKELIFDQTVTGSEKELISTTAASQLVELTKSVQVSIVTTHTVTPTDHVIDAYVPVTTFNSVRQSLTSLEIADLKSILLPASVSPIVQSALAADLQLNQAIFSRVETVNGSLVDEQIAFIPASQLNQSLKLLSLDGSYYLDDFISGAIFRTVTFDASLDNFKLETMTAEDVYKLNMTGVTALTRGMQRKLEQIGGDPLYFSAKIGDFLADADLTHVSNEVSFSPNCGLSNTVFCSPPEFIETLKASGVDLVEITGNHNNDLGSQPNTDTIGLYKSLGWGVVGGGLNTADAATAFVSDTKDSKVTFLAYNFPDSPNGGAIAGADRAGANSFDFDRIELEIAAAKQAADFVVVSVQYWECYAYPDGYIEYPICDKPIGEQEAIFKKLVDLGADMVVGSSAHQPQTYELHNGAPIYYGLGNLYFDQTNWPGTERGIVLTHYFVDGELLQTKLTPTVFDRDFQTRVSTAEESNYLLSRLQAAR